MNIDGHTNFLQKVLVLSVRKGFWDSEECKVFPKRLYTRTLMPGPGRFGTSRNPINNLTLAIHGYLTCLIHKPNLVLVGSATRLAPWFAKMKKFGLLPGTKLVVTSRGYLTDEQIWYVDRLILYSRSQIDGSNPTLTQKSIFFYLPVDGEFGSLRDTPPEDYIFTGGGAGRDFPSLIEAMRGLDIPLRIVTFSPSSLRFDRTLPDNCQVEWKMPEQAFLNRMAAARFVVVPLLSGTQAHGQTTIVQALNLGKAVISTRDASVEDYITHGQEGLLVNPGDIIGYREAIVRMVEDLKFRASCERNARLKAANFSYRAYADNLVNLCREMLQKT